MVSNYKNKIISPTYRLEPYCGPGSRHPCPNCGKSGQFTYYINYYTGEAIDPTVGRCNREINCGYHKTPAEFFKEQRNQGRKSTPLSRIATGNSNHNIIQSEPRFDSIDPMLVNQALVQYDQNNFITYLAGLFGDAIVKRLLERFPIGTSKHWPGATVFWQADRNGLVRTGKIMLYDSKSGRRVKEPISHFQWAHRLLRLPDFQLKQCLFGEDQLQHEPATKPISIVESEKTAIVASVYMPDHIWMATGGISGLTPDRLQVLKGRDIFLWPDLNAYDKWKVKAEAVEKAIPCNLCVSDLLEQHATEEARHAGYDIADYLVRRDVEFGWALSNEEYPLFWDLS